jgi:hypothetical protein
LNLFLNGKPTIIDFFLENFGISESGKDKSILSAKIDDILFVKPIKEFCSKMKTFDFNIFPASKDGPDTYPPNPMIIFGFIFFRISIASFKDENADIIPLKAPRPFPTIGFTSKKKTFDVGISLKNLCSAFLDLPVMKNIPTSFGSFSATAIAGVICPPVPPATIQMFISFIFSFFYCVFLFGIIIVPSFSSPSFTAFPFIYKRAVNAQAIASNSSCEKSLIEDGSKNFWFMKKLVI